MPKPPTSDDPLMEALRAAMQGPKRLVGAGGKNPVPGLFPSGKKGEAIADSAVADGYFDRTEEAVKVGKKTTKVAVGTITEKGIRAYVERHSPKEALTALLPAVQRLGESTPQRPDTARIVATIEASTAECVNAIKAAFAELSSSVVKAVAPAGGAAIDPAPILAALTAALSKVEPIVVSAPAAAPAQPPEPQPMSSAPAPKPTDESAVAEEIVSFVTHAANERTVGCDFVELFDHLKAKHPGLSIGTFHDALRALDQAGRIRLKDWPRMQDDIPRPELALFVSHTVMYHVQPVR